MGLARRIDRASGFTLLELVMVIVIVGALAAIVARQYTEHRYEAEANAMANFVKTVRSRVQTYHSEHGTYPATLDPSWFTTPLTNGYAPPSIADQFWVSNLPLNRYPSEKTVTGVTVNSMWYNRANGSFCVKVRPQANNAASLELFNRVNRCECTTMAQTSP